MQMSQKGLKALEQREGKKLKAYRDTKGIWTIGIGHSALAGTGPAVHPGVTINGGTYTVSGGQCN